MRVLWFDDKSKIPVSYDPATHPQKTFNFLFWADSGEEDALLIAGSGSYGREEDGSHRDASHKSLAAYARECGIAVPLRKPDGAGNLSFSDIVRDWSSTGFSVKTPPDLQPRIAAALGTKV